MTSVMRSGLGWSRYCLLIRGCGTGESGSGSVTRFMIYGTRSSRPAHPRQPGPQPSLLASPRSHHSSTSPRALPNRSNVTVMRSVRVSC